MRFLSSVIDAYIIPSEDKSTLVRVRTIQLNGETVWGWTEWKPDMFTYKALEGFVIPYYARGRAIAITGFTDKGRALLNDPNTTVIDFTRAKPKESSIILGINKEVFDDLQGNKGHENHIDTIILPGSVQSLDQGSFNNLTHIKRISLGPIHAISEAFQNSEFLSPIFIPEVFSPSRTQYVSFYGGSFKGAVFKHDAAYDVYAPRVHEGYDAGTARVKYNY